jgi:hypothetical protein
MVKYGKIIRVGPDTLLFNGPEAIKDIYTTGFSKSRAAAPYMEFLMPVMQYKSALTQNSSPTSTKLLRAFPVALPFQIYSQLLTRFTSANFVVQ